MIEKISNVGIVYPFKTDKTTTSKVLLEITTRMNLGRRGTPAKFSILDIVCKSRHSLEKVILK